MAKTEESGLMGKVANAATEKASRMAGGLVGEKAGQLASEAVEKYGPTLRRRLGRGLENARKKPVQSALYAAGALAAVAGLMVLINRLGEE